MKKWVFLAVVLALAAAARADDLLFMPTARRVLVGGVRAQAWFKDQPDAAYLTTGLGPSWEGQVSIDRFGGDPGRPTASLAYYYLSPIADIAPGICGGILDAVNQTTDGRRLYACATMNHAFDPNHKLGFTEFTVGFEVGRRPSPILGARTPLAKGFFLLAEYDGYRFNEGIEAKFGDGAYGRLALRGGGLYLGIGFRK